MLPDLLDTSASCFVVRIWGGQDEQYTLLLEWKVNLDGLRYTGQQVSNGGAFIFEHWMLLKVSLSSALRLWSHELNYLLPDCVHRSDPGIQMRSSLD